MFISSKSVEVAITNDILEDIQVIEPQIRTSDPKLYEVSTNNRLSTSYTLSQCVCVYKKHYVNVIRFSQALQDEVGRLTELINTTSGNESVAIFLCRRGAVHRKVSLALTQTSLGAPLNLTCIKKKKKNGSRHL